MKEKGSKLARRIVRDMEREKRFREKAKILELMRRAKQLDNNQENIKEE